jgi:hypothetical protein
MAEEKKQYRFIGSAPAQILDTSYAFTRYGQLVEMPKELYLQVKERIALIPAAEFDRLGHTAEEMKKYGRPSREGQAFPGHDALDPEFEEKRNQAFQIFHSLKQPAVEPQE